jgi:hypothetical protein
MTKRNAKAEDTPETDEAVTQADASAPGNDEVQAKADVETDQGFRGVEVDPTPNESRGRIAAGDGPGPR